MNNDILHNICKTLRNDCVCLDFIRRAEEAIIAGRPIRAKQSCINAIYRAADVLGYILLYEVRAHATDNLFELVEFQAEKLRAK